MEAGTPLTSDAIVQLIGLLDAVERKRLAENGHGMAESVSHPVFALN